MIEKTVLSGSENSDVSTIRVKPMESDVSTVRVKSMESDVSTVRVKPMESDVSIKTSRSNGDINWAGLMMRVNDDVEGFIITDFIVESGEAEIYKAVKEGKEYVVKIYDDKIKINEEVFDKLLNIKSAHLAQLIKVGKTEIQKREIVKTYFEIMPLYYVVDTKMSYDDEFLKLIEQVNEGLHELHEVGIFHKDIKPKNIMKDREGNYRIIDFGISSAVEKGQTSRINTSLWMSTPYASPDTRNNKSGKREDYYSFGMSIFEFFTGEVPYAKCESDEKRADQLRSEGVVVRESWHMPNELVKLIHGLTFYNNLNPEQRWGYEQVKEWLRNPDAMEDLDMKKLSEVEGNKEITGNSQATHSFPISFGWGKDKQLWDSYSIADAFGSAWKDGKHRITYGSLSNYFQDLGSTYDFWRLEAEDLIKILDRVNEEDADIEYWKYLYNFEPNLTKFYWREPKEDGTTGYTCEELGAYFFLYPMMDTERGSMIPKKTLDLINNGLILIYLKDYLKDENRYQKFKRLVTEYQKTRLEKTIWKMGYVLTGKAIFRYHNQKFETREALYEHMMEWTNSLDRDSAYEVMKSFKDTEEFKAWIEYQEEN